MEVRSQEPGVTNDELGSGGRHGQSGHCPNILPLKTGHDPARCHLNPGYRLLTPSDGGLRNGAE